MANPIVNLNVRANTARAMADFKKFSDSLNNKFLVSGLKVELISSTLRQISSELQKSIGEQGLLGSSSLRAAQNQAALLTSTFKGFGLEASKSINENMTRALSNVAIRAGGTVADIKKTLAASTFISTSLSSSEREAMAKQMLSFQRDLRRSGISEEFGNLAQSFLSANTNVGDMIQSSDPLANKIGMTMMTKYGAQMGTIFDPAQRTKVLQQILNDPELKRFLAEQARSTYGFKTYIEDLNTALFNPEQGLLGNLRKVKMSANRTTTVFDEADKIVNGIFGRQGIFVKFFGKIGQAFKIQDPLKLVIMGMDFIQGLIKSFSKFLDSSSFQKIVNTAAELFNKIVGSFESILKSNAVKKAQYWISEFFKNTVALFEKIVNSNQFSQVLSLAEQLFTGMISMFGDITKFLNQFITSIDVKAIGQNFSKVANIFKNIGLAAEGIVKELTNSNFDSSKITADISKAGEGLRTYIENIGKSIRGEKIDKPAEFGSTIIGTLVEEIGRTLAVLIKELGSTLISKVPEITQYLLPALNKAFLGIVKELFGPFAGIVRVILNFLPGPIGQIARASTGVSMFGGGGGGLLAAGALAFAPQLLGGARGLVGGLRGINENRIAFRGATEMIRERGLRDYAYRRLLRGKNGRWDDFDDGPGGGFLGIRNLRDSASNSFNRFSNAREQRLLDRIERGRLRDLSEGRSFTAYRRAVRGPSANLDMNRFSYAFDSATNQSYVTPRQILGQDPFLNLGPSQEEALQEKARIDALMQQERDNLNTEGYRRSRRIRNSRMSRLGRGIGRMGSIAGSGLRRAGRFARSPLGASLLIGGGILLATQAANASEGDPELTARLDAAQGDPIAMEELNRQYGASKVSSLINKRQEQQQQSNALNNVLGGAANGAMMGAMFGPWGALIGGVLGAGASLMDKGTRDAVGKWVQGIAKAVGGWLKNVWSAFTGFAVSVGKNLKELAVSAGGKIKEGVFGFVNFLLDLFTFTTRAGLGIIKNLMDKLPVPQWAKDAIGGAQGFFNTRLGGAKPMFASGLNDDGVSLAMEERMSGRGAFVANRGEFIIPPGGFSQLADVLERRIAPSVRNAPIQAEPKIQVTLVLNNPIVGSKKQVEDYLRDPVLAIFNEAYKKSKAGYASRNFLYT